MITPIEGLPSLKAATGKNTPEEGGVFADVFRGAIQNVKDTDAEKTEAHYLLSTGQLDNPAVATIASSKNQVAVELLVQLRNKAQESYSGLMSINI